MDMKLAFCVAFWVGWRIFVGGVFGCGGGIWLFVGGIFEYYGGIWQRNLAMVKKKPLIAVVDNRRPPPGI